MALHKTIKHFLSDFLSSGEYGKRMEERYNRTPEGKALGERFKKEGFFKSTIRAIRERKGR